MRVASGRQEGMQASERGIEELELEHKLYSLQDAAARSLSLSLAAHFFRLFLHLANRRLRRKTPFDSTFPLSTADGGRARGRYRERERERESSTRYVGNGIGVALAGSPMGERKRERGESGERRAAPYAVGLCGGLALGERTGRPTERASGESSRNGNGFSLSVSNADVERERKRGRAGVRAVGAALGQRRRATREAVRVSASEVAERR